MSRSVRGQKGWGFEYWSRRKTKDRCYIGRTAKRWTNRQERREGKELVRQ